MKQFSISLLRAAQVTIENCAAKPGETVVILTDTDKNPAVPEAFYTAAVAAGTEAIYIDMVPRPEILMDPPQAIIEALCAADLVIDAASKAWIYAPSMERILGSGTRMLQVGLIEEKSLLARPPDKKVIERGRVVKKLLANCTEFHITHPLGTDITLTKPKNRPGHAQDGVANEPGEWDGIATGISAFAPDEKLGDGVAWANGSVFMPMDEFYNVDTDPVKIEMSGGRLTAVSGGALAGRIEEWLAAWNDPSAYVISHVGFGIDHRAKLHPPDPIGAESMLGGVNFAFGSNTIPQLQGENPSPAHIDFVLVGCDVEVDGVKVLKEGIFTPESGMADVD